MCGRLSRLFSVRSSAAGYDAMHVDFSDPDPLTWWVITNPTAIHVCDRFRWAVTVGALILAALIARWAWQRRHIAGRVAAGIFATTCCLTASATEYDRLHQPVNIRLPLFVIGITAGFIWQFQSSKAEHDQRLEAARAHVSR